jgi:hypothetical protein
MRHRKAMPRLYRRSDGTGRQALGCEQRLADQQAAASSDPGPVG